MAHFSTHVLDATRGQPAAGIVVDLHALRGAERLHLQTLTTASDGRAGGAQLEPGVYELTYHAGDYFRAAGLTLSDPPFLDHIVIRFGIADTAARYHVPLLLTPYSYSTYRGS